MRIGEVRMVVDNRHVPMHMRVRFARRITGGVSVLVVCVVPVRMCQGTAIGTP